MMQFQRIAVYLLLFTSVSLSHLSAALSQTSATTATQETEAQRDGQHDFDFEIGTWEIHLSRLQDRLVGSKTWVKFDGTSVTRKVWDGRGNFNELETDSPTSHIEAGGHGRSLFMMCVRCRPTLHAKSAQRSCWNTSGPASTFG